MADHDVPKLACMRCGKCCYAVHVFTAGEDDMERWRKQGKTDIVRVMERYMPVWAGDIIVSSLDGKILTTCPFLRNDEKYYTCTIYEDRPNVCRNYLPGSSELCSQFKQSSCPE